jgi:hypothetical protein
MRGSNIPVTGSKTWLDCCGQNDLDRGRTYRIPSEVADHFNSMVRITQ